MAAGFGPKSSGRPRAGPGACTAGECLTHVEHIVGQDRDPDAAIRLAKRMIVSGEMPTPEVAHAQLRAEQERARLGQPITGDITARSNQKQAVQEQ